MAVGRQYDDSYKLLYEYTKAGKYLVVNSVWSEKGAVKFQNALYKDRDAVEITTVELTKNDALTAALAIIEYFKE